MVSLSNKRNICLAVFSAILVAYNAYRVVRLAMDYIELTIHEKFNYQPWSIVFGLLILVLIGAPLLALEKLKSGRIRSIDSRKSVFSLFRLYFPNQKRRLRSLAAAVRLKELFTWAHRLENGEILEWSQVKNITSEDLELVKQIVEEDLHITRHPHGGVDVTEASAWVLVISYMVLLSMFIATAFLAASEVRQENKNGKVSSLVIVKVLSEWTSNYVLLSFGFLQLFAHAKIGQLFQGILAGSFASMTAWERESLVALYIASTTQQIAGLKQDHCYAPIRMVGLEWYAPRVNTAILASLGERFSVSNHDGGWRINWEAGPDDQLVVRNVGYPP